MYGVCVEFLMCVTGVRVVYWSSVGYGMCIYFYLCGHGLVHVSCVCILGVVCEWYMGGVCFIWVVWKCCTYCELMCMW